MKKQKEDLNVHERQILAIINDASVKDFVHFADRYVHLSAEQVHKILERLQKDGLVEILEVADHDDQRYFHTKKVTKELLDESIESLVKKG
ncbi:MAG: helix-turn-helix domain-containing protein [Nanoarchaeota archaeon]